MRQTILEFPEVSLYYHPDEGIVHHEAHASLGGQTFRSVMLGGSELMEKHHACKWLSDDRRHVILPEPDEAWAATEWFPRTMRAGWRYWAVVRPERAIAELNVGRFIRQFGEVGITATLVSDFDTAWAWLVAQG